ncbi:MAG: hypothetical protein AAGF84_05545 [Planctomycetota bacterium]
MPPSQLAPPAPAADAEHDTQINIPPGTGHRLWKAIIPALRCPACGSTQHKAETGKRINGEGMVEQYRRCRVCAIRFRTVFE